MFIVPSPADNLMILVVFVAVEYLPFSRGPLLHLRFVSGV